MDGVKALNDEVRDVDMLPQTMFDIIVFIFAEVRIFQLLSILTTLHIRIYCTNYLHTLVVI